VHRVHDGQSLLMDSHMDVRDGAPGAVKALVACKSHLEWQRKHAGVGGAPVAEGELPAHKFGIPPKGAARWGEGRECGSRFCRVRGQGAPQTDVPPFG